MTMATWVGTLSSATTVGSVSAVKASARVPDQTAIMSCSFLARTSSISLMYWSVSFCTTS